MKKILLFSISLLFSVSALNAKEDPLPWANPWDVGMNYEFFNKALADLNTSITEKATPGVVILVIKDGNIITRRALGNRQAYNVYRDSDGKMQYDTLTQPMTEETLFDLASVTKMVSTTTSIMILVERGKIDLDKPVVEYIPSFGGRAKNKITVRHLITHSSGLPAWVPFYDFCVNVEDVYRSIDEDVELVYPPGEKRIYSDLGFIMLGRLIEAVSGKRIDHFSNENIFKPLGMSDTSYLPWSRARETAAPTEYDTFRNRLLQGIVHDENTRAMGGVSGHAGLFSTATDLAVYCQMLLNKGVFNGTRIMKEETIKLMLTPQLTPSAYAKGTDFLLNRKQLLGWWGMDDKATLNYMGGLPSPTAYSHTGFTGTALCIDPEHNCAAILLANAVHPRRADAQKSRLRRDLFINIAKALVGEDKVNVQPAE